MKRKWTDAQRQAAAERMRLRMAKKKFGDRDTTVAVAEPPKVRAPEVQTVLDSMTPERKAKLAEVQARTFARTLQAEGNAGQRVTQEALARHEAQKNGEPLATGNAPVPRQ